MILAEIFDFFLKLYDILSAGKSRQGTITSLVPVSSNQNELEMIEKDGFLAIEKVAKLQLLKKIGIILGFWTIRKIRILWNFPQGDHWDVVNRGQKRPFQAINYWPQDGRGQNTLEHPCSVPITSTFSNRFSCNHVTSHKYEGLITLFLSKITIFRKKAQKKSDFHNVENFNRYFLNKIVISKIVRFKFLEF